MVKRSLILGDSLTFGRPKYQIRYQETWPGLLEENGHKIFHRGRGRADSGAVSREASQLCEYMTDGSSNNPLFDFCFIQVGIVDCTPRLLPRRVEHIAKRLHTCRDLVVWLHRKRWLMQYVGRPWVNRSNFKKIFCI